MTIPKVYLGVFTFLFVFGNPNWILGQEKAVIIKGKVQSLTNDVSNVLVVNLNSKKSTITDAQGDFNLEVKLGDTIQISAVQYLTKEITITETILGQMSVIINVVDNIVQLNEVTLTPYNLSGKLILDAPKLGIKPLVDASELGLPNANLSIMTQSERLLLEADRGKYARFMTAEEKTKEVNILNYLTIGVILNPHKIINRISGRTKLFEDMVAREENLVIEKKILSIFSKRTMSENFAIPKENIDGFLTYCLSQKDFSELSNLDDMAGVWEYLKTKSEAYKEKDSIKK
ncbi:carboxypeptidase-like regulatory domain-containing protein [Flagellimonas flava]|uniref:CarboxypepD_reg-like domain-containing protein n=1 Tax=Flagellimonas flava TaxID=570519 RepID=A0A1M5HU23_9FLAO|nr:carboxypeptidase-like regulatory domain-containing protein [Allomuricauda flava]SHG19449.1 hypothetical protein SAMN04488116_0199 [Allomuricauda flava]